ncbi:class I SAM-dependent methyltransferase [Natronoglycomyces albus]|uniref:Class I SAM-dependent methyltransferase n=2 Tax=Natronoglycomyces albus TaxID=2811108 RepID=A0A895XT80_9ACTN|nr:class I SAM-dependent methyltransferase [Natronoglycomyces albus]
MSILDVGCGNGTYLHPLRRRFPQANTVGLDISKGILQDIEQPKLVANASALPFSNGSFDVVIAMHMLYHVENIDRAIEEAIRVLAPGGKFIASTNSAKDKSELNDLWRRSAEKYWAFLHLIELLSLPDSPSKWLNKF